MAELVYELSFKGVASDVLRAGFEDCELVAGHGTTMLRCGQESLQDALEQIQSFGLELLDVRLVAEPATDETS